MGETHTSVKDVIPDVGGKSVLDLNVINLFPTNSNIIEFISYHTAAWTRASRITIELVNGDRTSYFLKCATGEMGRAMMEAEHRSIREIYSNLPDFVPTPISWGKFEDASPETYFYLMEFLHLGPGIVEPPEFCRLLAQLQKASVSPTGKFGFNIVTWHGPNPQDTTWESSWCVYFTRLLTQFFEREIAQNGPQSDYEAAFKTFAQGVIPQILGPLQSHGRTLKPSLIHGDLWEENTGFNLATGLPVVFDASVMYAHNEMELGMWRSDRYRFGEAYFHEYLKHMPPSEPVEQFDDRNRLYGMKFTIAHCLGWPDSSQTDRQEVWDDMRYLSDKYAVKS